MVLTILWQVYMFLSAYESIQACQMMEELLGIYGKAFGSSNSWRNQALEPHSPLPKSFKVCKERARREEKQSEENRGKPVAVFFCTFGALTRVHFLHFIYHFKAQEFKNSMLQTERDSELKRRSYSHFKSITLKCCESPFCCENFAAFLYSVVDFLLKLPDIRRKLEAENLKVEANFAALRG